MRVRDMTFTSCGKAYWGHNPEPCLLHYTIRFTSVQLIEITDCIFRGNTGTAVEIVNSTALVGGSNGFFSNCRKCLGGCAFPHECIGGGIFAERSNVTFHGSNTFLANSAGYGGGAEAWDSDVRFSGIVIFRDNTAYQCGGGIHSRNSNISILDTSDIIVENNVAQYGGGVILQDSNITISGDITVRNNMAVVNGGGFSSYFNNIRLGDEIKIPSNKIYITGSMTVENNMARDGGGILLRNIDIIVSGDITVKNNTAKIGGGIHLFNCLKVVNMGTAISETKLMDKWAASKRTQVSAILCIKLLPLLENALKLNFKALYETENLDPLQGPTHTLTPSSIHTQNRPQNYGWIYHLLSSLAGYSPKLTATLKNRGLATLGFPKKFHAHQLKPTQAKASFQKVNLPPAKIGMLFHVHLSVTEFWPHIYSLSPAQSSYQTSQIHPNTKMGGACNAERSTL